MQTINDLDLATVVGGNMFSDVATIVASDVSKGFDAITSGNTTGFLNDGRAGASQGMALHPNDTGVMKFMDGLGGFAIGAAGDPTGFLAQNKPK